MEGCDIYAGCVQSVRIIVRIELDPTPQIVNNVVVAVFGLAAANKTIAIFVRNDVEH